MQGVRKPGQGVSCGGSKGKLLEAIGVTYEVVEQKKIPGVKACSRVRVGLYGFEQSPRRLESNKRKQVMKGLLGGRPKGLR
jgi:hypothetical protein